MTSSSSTKETKAKVGIFGRMRRSLKDMQGEMKRVVWPTRKQVINNTGIVLVFMLLASVVIGGFDMIMSALIKLFFGS